MYYMILAAMITTANAAPLPMPLIVGSYVSLDKCTYELVVASKYADFKLVKHPMFGKAIVKQYSKDGVTVLFCAKDMRSV
jgi:hypothetical protein